nr:immunoglobulin light chain junction region [Macaca mulatta]
CQQGNTIPGTF